MLLHVAFEAVFPLCFEVTFFTLKGVWHDNNIVFLLFIDHEEVDTLVGNNLAMSLLVMLGQSFLRLEFLVTFRTWDLGVS